MANKKFTDLDPLDHDLDGSEVIPVDQEITTGVFSTLQTTIGAVKDFVRAKIISTVNVWSKNQSVAPVTLTSSTSIAVDASQSNNFNLVLAHTATLANPTNLSDGMLLNFFIKIDSTGGRVLTLGSKFVPFDGGQVSTISTANGLNIMSAYYDATTDNLYYNILSKA